MSQVIPTRSQNYDLVGAQVADNTPPSIIELIARQLDRAEDARDRLGREGIVVRDMKGSVIAHPAVQIELSATKVAVELLAKHKKSSPSSIPEYPVPLIPPLSR